MNPSDIIFNGVFNLACYCVGWATRVRQSNLYLNKSDLKSASGPVSQWMLAAAAHHSQHVVLAADRRTGYFAGPGPDRGN